MKKTTVNILHSQQMRAICGGTDTTTTTTTTAITTLITTVAAVMNNQHQTAMSVIGNLR